MKRLTILMSFVLALYITGEVQAGDSLIDAFKEGKPYANARFRYEYVNQAGLSEKANASTVRTRLGFKTGKFYDLVGVIEGENVAELGTDDYNNTVNRKADHPVVADVENTQINQAYGEFTGIPDTMIRAGRQVITLDGHRFIGHVGWRQNNQVFDAARFTNTSIPDTTVKYGFIYNVNRIFGEQNAGGDWGSKSNFYNISNTSTPLGKITAYGYFLDFGNDSAANSSRTFGGSITGKKKLTDDITLKYHGEIARQADYADNPISYATTYYHFAPAIVWKGLTTTVGYEVLGSDDSVASFRTPLATGHKWNGWADKFLTTPASGLEDFYVDLTYKVKDLSGKLDIFNGLLAKLQYHAFNANDGETNHGSEWGVYLKQPINKNIYLETKFANYYANDTATDTKKVTFGVGIKY